LYIELINNFILPLSDFVLGLKIQKELAYWRKLQWYSRDELLNIQQNSLKNMLMHCSNNVSYYKELSKKINFNPDGNPFNELRKFPFLTKGIIKENLPDGILDKSRKVYFIDSTSGASGIQGEFYSDKSAYSKALAVQSLWWEWAGYRFGNKVVQNGITPKRGFVKGLKDKLLRVNYISAFKIDSDTILKNLKLLRGSSSYFFMGYPSSLYIYAKFAKENGINDIKFKSVVSWGDKMFSHYRKLIEEQFNTVVFDTYGASEGTMIAAECEYHNYHIMTPHVFIEILDEQGNEVKPGQIGEVVVTRLDNYLMPLIRYRIGDLAVKADPKKHCPCGRQLPMLEKIIGRDTDIVKTRSGKYLIVHFFTGIFEHIKEIQQFQVVQHSLDDIEIRYVPNSSFKTEKLECIKNEICQKAGEKVNLRFTKVSQIYPSRSGKPQIVISELKD